MTTLDGTNNEPDMSSSGHAYFTVTSISLSQLHELQTFLFDYLSVEFLNVEQKYEFGDVDLYGNHIPAKTSYNVECLLSVNLDNNGDVSEWIGAGIANSVFHAADTLWLIDREKLNDKKAELGLSDEDEYDPFGRWLSKYLFFDNFRGDIDITSRQYRISLNSGFVFEKKDGHNFIVDKRSDQEKSEAKYDLGRSHYSEKRFVEAADCFTYSAEKGNDRAQFNLAELYRDGSGAVPKNIENALHWFSLSADQGNEEATVEREKLLKPIK